MPSAGKLVHHSWMLAQRLGKRSTVFFPEKFNKSQAIPIQRSQSFLDLKLNWNPEMLKLSEKFHLLPCSGGYITKSSGAKGVMTSETAFQRVGERKECIPWDIPELVI